MSSTLFKQKQRTQNTQRTLTLRPLQNSRNPSPQHSMAIGDLFCFGCCSFWNSHSCDTYNSFDIHFLPWEGGTSPWTLKCSRTRLTTGRGIRKTSRHAVTQIDRESSSALGKKIFSTDWCGIISLFPLKGLSFCFCLSNVNGWIFAKHYMIWFLATIGSYTQIV